MSDHDWKPIEPLSDAEKATDLVAIRPLYETWSASKERLQNSSEDRLKDFNQQLVRRLSVETGNLERLYDLDRGTNEVLVTQGFAEDLVSQELGPPLHDAQ